MESQADELFFGGAAGGGKSDLVLGLALTEHKRSLILRRVASYLKGLVDRIKQIGGLANWRGSGHGGTMLIPPDGSVELGGCEHEKDKENYQGGLGHDLVAFDEISHFTKSQYQFITAWNRSVNRKLRVRVVCTGNPPTTPEGRWVVEEWAPWLDSTHPDPAKPGELRWYTTIEGKTEWRKTSDPIVHDGREIKLISRTFIPSRLSDNPFLEATDYGARLNALPEPLRTQLLFGDMNAGTEDDAWQVIPTKWIRAAQARWTENPPEGWDLSCLGVDVARGGQDKLAIAPRHRTWFGRLIKVPGKDVPDGSSAVLWIQNAHEGDAAIHIDITGGFGGSPYDLLKGMDYPVVGINFADGTEMKDRKTKRLHFRNVRAAMYWSFREALDPDGGEDLALPPDPELVADLAAPRYAIQASGILVESKEAIVSRLGRSPDCGDAVVMSHWQPVRKRAWIA